MTLKQKLAKIRGLNDAAETDLVRYAWRLGKNLTTLLRIFKTLVTVVRVCWDNDGDIKIYWRSNYVRVVIWVRDDLKKSVPPAAPAEA